MTMYKMPAHYSGLDLLASMIVVVQADGCILYANTAFKNFLGLSRPSFEPFKLGDLLEDERLGELLHSVAQEEISSAQLESELFGLQSQANQLPAHLLITKSNIEGELLVEIFPMELQARQEREERTHELSRANKEMIRNLAHEVKNPLGGIRGAAQLLQMEIQAPDLTEYLKIIIHEVDRLQGLVDRMLEPHRQAQVLEAVNIHEVCERVASLIQAEFPQGLKIIRDYDASIPELQADKSQLIQAVLNIARNAAQALSAQIANNTARIEFRTRVVREMVPLGHKRFRMALELHIIDNGAGILKEIQDQIFYPLVSGKEEGTGLGLTLAQIFIHQHNGLIECISKVGYTAFKITLPLLNEGHGE